MNYLLIYNTVFWTYSLDNSNVIFTPGPAYEMETKIKNYQEDKDKFLETFLISAWIKIHQL
jgi:hypothetical protein